MRKKRQLKRDVRLELGHMFGIIKKLMFVGYGLVRSGRNEVAEVTVHERGDSVDPLPPTDRALTGSASCGCGLIVLERRGVT